MYSFIGGCINDILAFYMGMKGNLCKKMKNKEKIKDIL